MKKSLASKLIQNAKVSTSQSQKSLGVRSLTNRHKTPSGFLSDPDPDKIAIQGLLERVRDKLSSGSQFAKKAAFIIKTWISHQK